MVAANEPLAAQAGLDVLRRGGNAVDAAIASAATLTVLEPTGSGIGGDAFALIWDGNKLWGLDGSGRAPSAHTLELFLNSGRNHMPTGGWLTVTVPGAPAAWRDMHRRFGNLAFDTLFEAAIDCAQHGFPVSPVTAQTWGAAAEIFAAQPRGPEFAGWPEAFAPGGRPPDAGDLWQFPDCARTLRILADSHCDALYKGELAARISDFAEMTGGLLGRTDLAEHASSWVEPLSISYRDHEVWELPPNCPGVAVLAALNILGIKDIATYPRDSVESYHLQIEATKLALTDVLPIVQPSEHGYADFLGHAYAADRSQCIGTTARGDSRTQPLQGGTTYLCVADGDGMMVSLIQSNYSGWLLGFGSGVVVPGTGIALQSRGLCFSLDSAHPHRVGPRKKPPHTLAPGFLTHSGQAVGPFGLSGGPMQPQGHVQLLVNLIDYGMNPQSSLDAPRWQWIEEAEVEVEMAVPRDVVQGLAARGHQVSPHIDSKVCAPRLSSVGLVNRGDFGKGHIIARLPSGVYVAGSDPRAGGYPIGF